MPSRKAMDAIFYLLQTGCQWKALPRSVGAGSTVHDRFQAWREAGRFRGLWQEGLIESDANVDIESEWQVMDGAMTKAPRGGGTSVNPTDRGKRGTERSPRIEGTLQSVVLERLESTP